MKSIYIIGNWKSNKDTISATGWYDAFAPLYKDLHLDTHLSVVVCAPFTDLYPLKQKYLESKLEAFSIGAQDVSPYPEGAYTGEESAKMIKELADWVIIGHSERRKYMHEDDTELFAEVEQAKKSNLNVIYCVSDVNMKVPSSVDVIGYEPLWAIGTGKTDTPENANSVILQLKAQSGVKVAVYGGSITAENVSSFVAQSAIDGVLVGGASLDPQKFITLIHNAKGSTV